MQELKYKYYVNAVRASQQVQLYQGCNGFVAINKGLDEVVIDNLPLLPPPGIGLSGESFGVAGNVGEVLDKIFIEVVFNTTTGPLVYIVQKVYNFGELSDKNCC